LNIYWLGNNKCCSWPNCNSNWD